MLYRPYNDLWTLGIRIGLEKGHQTTIIPKKAKPSHLKGRLSKKTQFVRSVVREVVGFAPYERRVLELLRNSKVSTLRHINDSLSVHSTRLTSYRIRRPGS
jgi:large subunit ribosomal protein L36e